MKRGKKNVKEKEGKTKYKGKLMLQGKIYAKEVDDKPKGCVRSKFGISWEGRKNIIFGWGGGAGMVFGLI
jgi:hypothetical protein